MSATTTPKLIARYAAAGILRKLQLGTPQVRVDTAPWYDPGWRSFPLFQVIPGRASPEGKGSGGQEGGGLFRRQYLAIHVYYRCELDEYQNSQELLTRDSEGLLDLFEQLRTVFELTYFGDGETFLLTEPVRWENESEPVWVDEEQRIVRRTLSLSAPYGVRLPDAVSLNLADVT